MYRIVYLPTAEVIEYPSDFRQWYRPNSIYAKDIAEQFLKTNEAYQIWGSDKIIYLTFEEIIAATETPGKKIPKHLLEVIDV
jgi:hypothetical protein